MPKATRETALPKAPVAAIEWIKIAKSARVWDFVQDEDGDFTGKPEKYRARLKTEARKQGVDFESVIVERNGSTVLKVLAFEMNDSYKHDRTAREKRATASGEQRRESERRESDHGEQLRMVA